MNLSPDKWEKVKILFEDALDQGQGARTELLNNAEDDVRQEVERLLMWHGQLGHFLTAETVLQVPQTLNKKEACAAGDVLANRFRIARFIAKGGMGEVYEAEDLELGERVAIKMIRAEMMSDPASSERLKREVRLAKQVTHPNVCRIFDLFRHHSSPGTRSETTSDLIFVSMELLRGETLSARLKRSGRMSGEEALPIVMQMASALQAAHETGIVHRDFKPGNVFLVPAQDQNAVRTVVTDFGLALGFGSRLNAGLTPESLRHFLGTPAYMSPEQIEGKQLTPASDIYALGLVMYEMVTGALPFEDETPIMMTVRRLREPPPSPRVRALEVERVWETVILRCLQRDPSRRFASAEEAAKELQGGPRAAGIPRRTHKNFESLAVLPFVNASGAPDADYLSDGITDTIINTLSRLPKLRVMARSTVFRYKGQNADPQSVGRQLGVDSVLTGRMVQQGGMLMVSTELVDVNDGWQLWGEQYKYKLDDIFVMYEEIANTISTKLRLRLSGDEKKQTKLHAPSTEAYQLYLRGRYHWNKRTEESIRKAIAFFDQSIQCDPMCAQAYAGLADSYTALGFLTFPFSAPREIMPKARAAALEALKIDETLAEAHASLGVVALRYDWDLREAARHFRRAIELNPGYAVAHQWYGECLAAMTRMDDAIIELKRALEFDPLSLTINSVLAVMYYFAHQFSPAIDQCRKTLEIEKNFWLALQFLGLSYEQVGDLSRALSTLEKGITASRKNPVMLANLGHAYAVAGRRDQAEKLLGELKALSHPYIPRLASAFISIALGAHDAAFADLDKAFEQRSGWLVFARVDPRFDPLRPDARFDELLQRMGLLTT